MTGDIPPVPDDMYAVHLKGNEIYWDEEDGQWVTGDEDVDLDEETP